MIDLAVSKICFEAHGVGKNYRTDSRGSAIEWKISHLDGESDIRETIIEKDFQGDKENCKSFDKLQYNAHVKFSPIDHQQVSPNLQQVHIDVFRSLVSSEGPTVSL